MKLLNNTQSICPVCLKKLPAEVVEEDNRVYITKACPSHGAFKALLEKDVGFYKQVRDIGRRRFPKFYIDWCKENVSVVLPITDRCNMKCKFCFYPNKKNEDLSIDEIMKISESFDGRLSLSGGEPTVHPDLPEIINRLIEKCKRPRLVTNGLKLADISYLKKLYEAGLREITLSVNAFDDKILEKIDGRAVLGEKLKALDNLKQFDIQVELSLSLLRGTNEGELKKAIDYCIKSDNIVALRVRSYSQIGRYLEDHNKLFLSDMVGILASALGIEKIHLTKDLSKRIVSAVSHFNATLYFYRYDAKYEFLASSDGFIVISLKTLPLRQKIKWSIEVIRIRGFKIFLRILILRLRGKGEFKRLHIKLWHWPDKLTYEVRDSFPFGTFHLNADRQPGNFFQSLIYMNG